MRYLCCVSYDGSSYYGWNKQKNKPTIQGEIENTLSKLFKTPVKIIGCGRTDKGVSAMNMYFHFDAKLKICPTKIVSYLNKWMPNDILVKSCICVNDKFHARFSVKSKTYIYKIRYDAYSWVDKKYFYIFPELSNFKEMKKASKSLIGEKDFSTFSTKTNLDKNNIRKISKLKIIRSLNGLIFIITGDGFLHHMVRKMIYELLQVGIGVKNANEFKLLLLKKDYKLINAMVPSHALTLKEVYY